LQPFSGVSHSPEDAYKKESRLSRGLESTIHDHESVPYLIQYLESCKASPLVRFWLDAESFQASTWTRIRTHSLQSVSKSSLVRERNNSSSMSTTSSFSKDITSPVSLGSTENDVQETAQTNPSFTQHSDSKLQNCDNSTSETTTIKSSSQNNLTQQCDSSTSANEIVPGADINVTSNKSDSRERERCKDVIPASDSTILKSGAQTSDTTKMETSKESLGLTLQNCDMAMTNSSSQGASVEGECAISYRDLASPSPSSTSAGGKAENVVKSSASSISNLAEKLKKSKLVFCNR